MFLRACFWDNDNTILAETPIQDNSGRRLADAPRNPVDDSVRIAIANPIQTFGERTVSNNRHLFALAILQQTKFNCPIDQVVADLIGNNSMFAQCPLRGGKLGNGKIAYANEPDFPTSISPSIVPMVSSIGIFGFGWWSCRRSITAIPSRRRLASTDLLKSTGLKF
jgi:hypothetical protein